MGRSAGKWNFLFYDIGGASLISVSVCQVNLLQDDIKFIVVAIVSSAVSWTMVNRNNIMMNKSELLAINQRWAGDRLAGFVKAVLKECSCSMALITG